MPQITASTKKYGTPSKPRPMAEVTPMIRPSSNWPLSHALTFIATRSATSVTRAAVCRP